MTQKHDFKKMCEEEYLIQPNEYKVRWMEYLEQRKNVLWTGVVPVYPSLIQFFFAEIELGVSFHHEITVTVLRCNKLKWAYLTIDGDGNLKYRIDLCNCPRDCEHYDKNTCRLGLKKDDIKEM